MVRKSTNDSFRARRVSIRSTYESPSPCGASRSNYGDTQIRITMYDHQHAARLLAKCAAYINCGKPETARRYMGELAAYLESAINATPAAQPATASDGSV